MQRIQPDEYKKRMKKLQDKRDELTADNTADFEAQVTHYREVLELQKQILEYKKIIEAAQQEDFKELQTTFRNHPRRIIYSTILGHLFDDYKAFTQPDSYIFTIFPDHIDAKADLRKQRSLTPTCSR